MADRTFHKRFTLTARIGVAVFAILALYFFWVKLAIIGIFVAIIIVGMIERILNTTYTFKMVKPIDLDEEMEYLIINEGRFSSNRNVPLCDVIDVHIAKTFFGLDHCVVTIFLCPFSRIMKRRLWRESKINNFFYVPVN